MAGLDANKVYAPTPNQSSTTGAVQVAPEGTTGPTDAKTALSSPWVSGGYVDENGISVNTTRGVTPLKDWSKSTVRNLKGDYDSTITLGFLQVDEFSAKRMFGADNVTVTAATNSTSEQIKIAIGNNLPPVESWCFSMKDENRRVRVYVPRGQMVEVNQFAFKPDVGNTFGGTLHTLDDGTGNSIYFFYDDGTVLSA